MGTLGATAPIAPAAGYSVVALGALIAFVVCWGLMHAWKATFGAFLKWLAGIALDFDHWVVHIHWAPFRFAHTVSVDVERWLSQGMALSEHAMVHAFNAALSIVTDLGAAVFHLGENTYTALRRLAHALHHELPAQIRDRIVRPLVRRMERTLGRIQARAVRLEHSLAATAARLTARAHVLAHSIAQTFPRIGTLEREAGSFKRWLRKHAWLGAYGSVLALGLAIVRRLGLGFLRCTKIKRVGRQICGMDARLLESLLGSALLLTSVLSLREMARELEQPTDLVADALKRLVREL